MKASRVRLFLALAMPAAGCTGGGGDGGGDNIGPCCGATGSAEPVTQSFAGAPAGTWLAEPVVFPAGQCLSFDAAGRIVMPADMRSVGDAAPVGPDGRYTVDVSEAGANTQVYVRIYEASAPEQTLGAAAVPTTRAADSMTYHVTPIAFAPAGPALGESTIELRATCLFDSAIATGDVTIPDVRSAITRGVADEFRHDAVGAESRLMDAVLHWQHAVDGLASTISGADAEAQRTNFGMLREMAQCNVCFCRDGAAMGNWRMGCSSDPADQATAEFVRGWTLLHVAGDMGVDLGRPMRDHVLAWGIDLEKRVAASVAAGDVGAIEMARQARMLRFEAADQAIQEGAAVLGLDTAGQLSLGGALDVLRDPILTSTTGDGLAISWQDAANDAWSGLLQATALDADGCVTALLADAAGRTATAPWSFPGDVTHDRLLDVLFDDALAFRDAIETDAAACPALADPAERAAWIDIVTHLSVNGAVIR